MFKILWCLLYFKKTKEKILPVLQCHWPPWRITSVQTWKDCSSLPPTPFLCTYHQTSSGGLNSSRPIFCIKTMVFLKGEHHLLASKYRLEIYAFKRYFYSLYQMSFWQKRSVVWTQRKLPLQAWLSKRNTQNTYCQQVKRWRLVTNYSSKASRVLQMFFCLEYQVLKT